MKSIVALTSLALVSFSSVAPCLAATQAISRSPNPSLSSQPLPDTAKTTLVAGFNFGGLLNQGLDIVNKEQRRKEEEERKAQLEKERQVRLEQQEKERQERLERQKKYQAELEAANKKATERQRLEAERRQKYFESLSPAQQEAYIAQQRARQKEADVAAGLFFLKLLSVGAQINSVVSPPSNESQRCWAGTPEETLRRCPPGSY